MTLILKDVPPYQKSSFKINTFKRQTDTHTHDENVYTSTAHAAVNSNSW